MKEVEYHELQRWGWDCPECDHWNEIEDDPAYEETISCDGCGQRFSPIPG